MMSAVESISRSTQSEPILPTADGPWLRNEHELLIGPSVESCDLNSSRARAQLADKPWVLPTREHIFFTDLHADGDALLASLVASGAITRPRSTDTDFELTERGRRARIVFGGDYFDKGPCNLRVLRILRQLETLHADDVLLAGNHDVRTYLGIRYAEERDPLRRHLFVRMGRKTLTLLHEIWCDYVDPSTPRLSNDEVKERLFPGEDWYANFADHAKHLLSPRRIDKELARIREKASEIEGRCTELGMSLPDLYEALGTAQRLFLEPDGEFSWLFRKMQLAYRSGSLVFLHAGIDDICAEIIATRGIDGLNESYREELNNAPFECYNGHLGNCFRTKYRDGDFPFTELGGKLLRRSGIYALVHGHRNLRTGQRLTLRNRILNIECDTSMDCNTRALEGIAGLGASYTTIACGQITAVSTDHRLRKCLRPDDFGASSVARVGTGNRSPSPEKEKEQE